MVAVCPCGRKKPYSSCCGLIHTDIHQALTAEDLMRSRYTAFTMALGDYLMQSHQSGVRPEKDKASIVAWAKRVQWVKLEVLQTIAGGANDQQGMVEFKANFMEEGQAEVIHEKSAFIRENGHWVYLAAID